MLAPVVLFVYKRLEHTIEMIESLSRNQLAKDTDVFIFADGAKNVDEKKEVLAVRQYIHSIESKNWFKKVIIEESDKNRGLANSVIAGVSEIINKFGKAIVIEDDLLLSVSFLQYMNDALDFYQDDMSIWSVSGFSFPMGSLVNYQHDVFYTYRGSSWGWGTWLNRWNLVDWDMKDYDEFFQDKKRRKKFCRGGNDLPVILEKQMTGEVDSWAIRWCYAQSMRDMYSIYPRKSLVYNAGFDGSGTHIAVSDRFDTAVEEQCVRYRLEKLELERSIVKDFHKKYSDTKLSQLKSAIYKIYVRCLKNNTN